MLNFFFEKEVETPNLCIIMMHTAICYYSQHKATMAKKSTNRVHNIGNHGRTITRHEINTYDQSQLLPQQRLQEGINTLMSSSPCLAGMAWTWIFILIAENSQ